MMQIIWKGGEKQKEDDRIKVFSEIMENGSTKD